MITTLVLAMSVESIRRHGRDQGLKSTFTTMLDALIYMDLLKRMNSIQECRPFVTDRAWGLFSAYNGFYVSSLMRAVAIKLGDQNLADKLWKGNTELSVVRAAAPPEMFKDTKRILSGLQCLSFRTLKLNS